MTNYQDLSKEELVAKIRELEVALEESRKKAESQEVMLDVLAVTDNLTKLLTYNAIYSLLEEEIVRAKRYETPLSILLLDVKAEDLPHHHALSKASVMIKDQIRKVDKAGRYGDDEVLVIFPSSTLAAAQTISERLRISIENLGADEGTKVSVNGGLSTYDGEDVIDFLGATEALLANAKANSKNQIRSLES